MKPGKISLGCLALVLGGSSLAWGDSLWQRRTPEHAFLFYDSKARNVGDRVTVLISQSTGLENSEDRGMKKATETKGVFDFDSSAAGGFGDQGASASLDVGSTSSRKFDGGSNYSSEQTVTDRITATVMDVLPNGDMVIAGDRRVRIAGEERTLVLTGIIRGLDIGPDNTINSRYISEPRIEYESGGPSQKFTRQGWLGRAMNAVWPF